MVIKSVLTAASMGFLTTCGVALAAPPSIDSTQVPPPNLVYSLPNAASANWATNSGHANTADSAGHANSANYASNAGHANFANTANNAGYANSANTANWANGANYASSANHANSANAANRANYANSANHANSANFAAACTGLPRQCGMNYHALSHSMAVPYTATIGLSGSYWNGGTTWVATENPSGWISGTSNWDDAGGNWIQNFHVHLKKPVSFGCTVSADQPYGNRNDYVVATVTPESRTEVLVHEYMVNPNRYYSDPVVLTCYGYNS